MKKNKKIADKTSEPIASKYNFYVHEVEEVVKPELINTLKSIYNLDLNDYFFQPDTWFRSETEARGFVISLFLKEARIKKMKSMLSIAV